MSWSILLLPLLGGYYFLSRSIKWKHYYKRKERQRLIFDSLLAAAVFLSFCLALWFTAKGIWPQKVSHLLLFTEITIPYFFPSLMAFILAVLFTQGFNLFNKGNKNWYLAKAIEKTGNSLQIDFLESYFFDRPVMFSLKNGKVYVGTIAELHEPHPETSFVKLVLLYSGYRTDKMDISLEKDYNLNIYSQSENPEDPEKLVTVVIAEAEILSMTFYDQDVYDRLN